MKMNALLVAGVLEILADLVEQSKNRAGALDPDALIRFLRLRAESIRKGIGW